MPVISSKLTTAEIKALLGITTLSGSNTGDETATTIRTKLGITTLSGSNTGDQIISDATITTTDVTTNNATTSKHGFLPKLGGGTSNFLRADGTWATPAGAGDMAKATYDPTNVSGDAFSMDNMVEGTNTKILTSAERTILGNTSNTNTGDETATTIKTKLGITTLSGDNTGDETVTTIKTKLGITTLSGDNTGDQDLSGYRTKAISINSQTGTTYTLVLADDGKLLVLSNANPITLTVPPNSSVAFPVGTQIDFVQYLAGAVTVDEGSGVTVNSLDGNLTTNGQFVGCSLIKIGTDTWILVGNLTT